MAKGKKILSFLKKPMIQGLVKSIPFVGDVADNMLTSTDRTGEGQLDTKQLGFQLVRLAVLAGILYLVFSGKIDMDAAEDYKEFLTQ
ncbi:unnamed protein product [marine sediment metagenome]|uniref:Uncharacterized protein n=1 Tax=marine sediment metagenome TaxID=412755 RepID=X1B0W3_9ZZZZ